MHHNYLNQIIKSYHENRLSHAFLIETNNQVKCFEDLKKIIKEINCEKTYKENCSHCNLCHLIDIEQLPSLEIIRLEGQLIKKEQILNLKQRFSTKPIFSKYNIYIILNSEKFNPSSANAILKFLEEPEIGVLGFFITNNKENVIDTIKSRCQIIPAFYDTNLFDFNIESIAVQYLKLIHESSDLSLQINREFFLDYDFSKEQYQLFFQTIFHIYYELYRVSINYMELTDKYNELKFLLKKNSSYFLNQLDIVKQLEEELSYNVNINLLLDRFLLETRS